jgi:UDP-N-acetylmuramoylalanine--D-glutamate ligase
VPDLPDHLHQPLDQLGRHDSWEGVRAVVAGFGVSGFAAADNLTHLGATVTALDDSDEGDRPDKAELLEILGATVRLGPGSTAALPDDVDVVITSPGWRPDAPLLAQATARGVPVWGEVELAWRLRDPDRPAPWLAVTGTNGKTTTVQMLEAILRRAGLRTVAAGNVGLPIVEAVMDPEPYDVLAVELSSFQLHWQRSVSAVASAVLNVAPDHIDWHGSYAEYLRAKGKIYENTHLACIYNVADIQTEQLVMEANVVEGCRAVGFTTGIPAPSMVGVVEDVLADRAFVEQRQRSAAELCTIADLQGDAPSIAPHYIANALAAAALARAYGVGPIAVRDGLRAFRPDRHRIAEIATVKGVRFVNDSKATNPHAAAAAIRSFDSVVWIAGGLLKGADVDSLVEEMASRLRGVVLIGADRDQIAQALSRHAPDVPVVDLSETDTGVMDRVVREAARLAQPGDVVLLAPAAASMDMFTNYGARGDAFEEAVRRHLEAHGGLE